MAMCDAHHSQARNLCARLGEELVKVVFTWGEGERRGGDWRGRGWVGEREGMVCV